MADSTGTAPMPAAQAGAPTPSAAALHIVLFGLPAAGKSSLLGALAQAAQTQQYDLDGRLIDLSPSPGNLAELQHRLYEGPPRGTREEVVPYTVEFESFAKDARGNPANEKFPVRLIDCDGKAANDLLERRRSLNDGGLAAEVCEADALILVVDASTPDQIDAEFKVFGRFLRLLEQNRGQRSEVGGLPVFLTLSKCDLLAQPSDKLVDWYERIEEQKRSVGRRFQDFITRQSREGPLPFGRINLQLWATAVKRPALVGQQARPREPYGVAKLFRQAIDSARKYQHRQEHSTRRLLWTVSGALGFFAVLVALTVGMLLNRPGAPPRNVIDLQNIVANYKSSEKPTASGRLRGDLLPKIAELKDVKSDPNFGQLKEDTQEFVDKRLKEMEAYSKYRNDVQQTIAGLDRVTTEDQLQAVEDSLRALNPPPDYRDEWKQTEAEQQKAEALEDVKAVGGAIDDVRNWYKTLKDDGNKFLKVAATGPPAGWARWHDQVKELFKNANSSPYPGDKSLPGRTNVTYRTVLNFNRVKEARDDWDSIRDQLKRIRDLSAVLGIASGIPGLPSLLVIPSDGFTVRDAESRLGDLKQSYPDYAKDFRLDNLPGEFVAQVRRVARTNYDALLEPAREAVKDRWKQENRDGKETLASWRKLLPWLNNPRDLQDWRELAEVLGRLNPRWVDPIAELRKFLEMDEFRIDLKYLNLQVSADAEAKYRLKPGDLKIYLTPPGQNASGPKLVFTPSRTAQPGEAEGSKVWSLRPETSQVLRYEPGDDLWALMPVSTNKAGEWKLTWARARSLLWQFERLVRPPRLHAADKESATGDLIEGVSLVVTEGTGVPKVPDLLPIIKP